MDLLCTNRIGLWNGFTSIWIRSLDTFAGGYFDGAYIKACGAFNVLALLSSFMASMVFSFLCFVMICASIKITGPIVRNPKTVVVVNSNAGQQAVVVQDGTQVVMAAPPQQQQQVVYANQQPPAYGDGEYKQPGQPGY